jgi:hypothetical protein
MLSKRATRGALTPAVSNSILLVLDEDAVVEVLHAAKAAKTLADLASCSRRLCTLARSRLPLRLSIHDSEQVSLVLQSIAHGRPPFTGCTSLYLSTDCAADCLMATTLLAAAVQWTGLQQLQLALDPGQGKDDTVQELDMISSGVLSALPALKQLRRLELNAPAFDAWSAKLVGQLEQLTYLEVALGSATPFVSPATHLTALSGLKGLQELYLLGPPPVQPAAGVTGPFSLPSSLKKLTLAAGWCDNPAATAAWVTHLPGCPQLQHLSVEYTCTWEHPSTHPSVLVLKLAAHNPHLRTLEFQMCEGQEEVIWGSSAEGSPEDAVPAPWHPTAAMAALTGLEQLSASGLLRVTTAAHWQHLAQLTALSS